MNKQLEHRPCDLCGASEFRTLRARKTLHQRLDHFSSSSNTPLRSRLVRCMNCGLVFVNPRPLQDELIEAYGNAVDEDHSVEPDLRIRSFIRAMNKVVSQLPGLSPSMGLRLVDIGCAGGEFPSAAAGLGFDVVAYEPSLYLSSIGRARYGLDIRTGTFNASDFQAGDVDLVTMWDVLEHLDEPSTILMEIAEVLKNGGYLLLNVPMVDTVSARTLRRLWPFYLEVHLYYFTRMTLKKYLNKYGFEIVYEASYSQTLGTRYLIRRATSSRIRKFWPNFPLRYKMGQRTIVARRDVVTSTLG